VVGVAVIGGHRVEVPTPPSPSAPVVAAVAPDVVPLPPSLAQVARVPVILTDKRHHGTDGLMGRLPFGLAGDSPTVFADRQDRFEMEPLITWSMATAHEPARPTYHQGGLSNPRADVYAR
jgi:hypothetical protein